MTSGSREVPERLVVFATIVVVAATTLEVLEPVFVLGPYEFTTPELAVGFFLLALLVWAIKAGRSMFSFRYLDLGILLFLASNYLASAFSDDRPSALKFSLRLTYGALVYFGVSRLPKRYRPHLVVAGSIAATLVIVSVAGVTENFFLSLVKDLLSPFREKIITFGAYYNVRISSTFPFPTIFAFYVEMLIPIVLCFGLWWTSIASNKKTQWLRMGLTFICTFIPLTAIAYTYTRSAYVAAPATLLLGAVVAMLLGLGRRVYLSFAASAIFFIILLGMSALFSNTMAFRLGLAEQEHRFDAAYELTDIALDFKPGDHISSSVHVVNLGTYSWGGPEERPTYVVYRWLSYPGMKQYETELVFPQVPHKVEPGGGADVDVEVATPVTPGRYILVYEMFIDSPFSHAGVNPLVVPIDIEESGGSLFEISEPPSTFYDRNPAPMSVPRRQLWRASTDAWKENPILGLGPDQFRKRYDEFIPGAQFDPRLGAHNIFLDAMANTGTIGLLALIYLLGITVVQLFRLARRRSATWDTRLLSLGVLVAMISYVLHGMLEYPLWQTGVMLMWFILLGMVSLLAEESGAGAGR